MIHAIEVIGTTGASKVFKPTGVTDEWECVIQTARGPEPGGCWTTLDVALAVVEDIYRGAA